MAKEKFTKYSLSVLIKGMKLKQSAEWSQEFFYVQFHKGTVSNDLLKVHSSLLFYHCYCPELLGYPDYFCKEILGYVGFSFFFEGLSHQITEIIRGNMKIVVYFWVWRRNVCCLSEQPIFFSEQPKCYKNT